MKKLLDFSELDKARAELQRSEQKLEEMDGELHTLVQAVSAIYFRLGPDGTILSYKAASSPQFRFIPENPAGRRVQDILPSPVARQVLETVTQVHQEQTSSHLGFSIIMDGQTQNFEARLFPFIKKQAMALVRPATEPRQDSEWLTVNRRLISLGQIAAGVAHELNNPLSVILGFTQSLSLHPQDSGSLTSSLEAIEREALRCKRLIQDLLIFSRSPKPGKTPEDLAGVLQGTLSLIEAQARICHVEVVADFGALLPPVAVDRHRIQQLLVNLCLNAIDAMPHGGTLTVGLALGKDGKNLSCAEILVRDTGVGVPNEVRDRIFEPFFTTKEPGKGTGLGLSFVQDIVKEHHGSIQFRSEVGKGTTFLVRLPLITRNPDQDTTGESRERQAVDTRPEERV